MRRRRSSWTSISPEPERKPSSHAERRGRIVAARQRQREAIGGRAWIGGAGVEAHPPRPAGHEAVDVGVANLAERVVPQRGPVRTVDRRERALDAIDPLPHRARGVVIERRAGGKQADGDTREQARHDRFDERRVGAADVAVAQHAREPRQRGHQMREIGGHRRHRLDPHEQRFHRARQIGQHHIVQQLGELAEIRGPVRAMRHGGRGRGGHGVAPLRRFDHLDRELRPPLQRPDFVERAEPLLLILVQLTPRDAEHAQAMQQPARARSFSLR